MTRVPCGLAQDGGVRSGRQSLRIAGVATAEPLIEQAEGDVDAGGQRLGGLVR